jgi:hypothetical protein
MAIALVSQNDATGASTSPAVTLSVTSGNLLVFCWVTRNGTGTHNSLADSQTQTWTQAGTPVAVDGYASVWYCQNTFTGSLTVTGTLSGSDTWYVNLSEWSGQHASSPYVSTDSHPFSTSTTHVFGDTGISVTTGQLLIGCASPLQHSSLPTAPTFANGGATGSPQAPNRTYKGIGRKRVRLRRDVWRNSTRRPLASRRNMWGRRQNIYLSVGCADYGDCNGRRTSHDHQSRDAVSEAAD